MPLLRLGAFAILPFLASSHLKERPPGGEPAALQLGGGGVIQEQRPTDHPVDQGPQLSELPTPPCVLFLLAFVSPQGLAVSPSRQQEFLHMLIFRQNKDGDG